MEQKAEELLARPVGASYQTPVSWYLEAFAEEILGLTCSFSGLEALTRLFCTGSSLLRKKLDSPSCRLELRWIGGTSLGNRPWKKFPRFIASLKGVRGVTLIEPKNGGLIPSSLIIPSSRVASNTCLPSTLDSMHIMSSSIDGVLKKGRFPNLTYLCVQDSKDPDPSPTFWKGVFKSISQLQHLRALRLREPNLYDLSLFAPLSLPSCLETLSLLALTGRFEVYILRSLPCLKVLEIPCVSGLTFEKDHLPIPDSLTCLNIHSCCFIDKRGAIPTMTQPSRGLPRIIQDEELMRCFFFGLPPQMASLVLHSSLIENLIQATQNDGLPKYWDHLTTLKINGKISKLCPLPSHLLSLTLEIPVLPDPDRLPKNLQWLSLPKLKTLAVLPSKLSTLVFDHVKVVRSGSSGSGNHKLGLPASLTHLIESQPDNPKLGLISSEVTLLRSLPDTVLLYEGSCNFYQIPERFRKQAVEKKVGIEQTNFTNLHMLIEADCLDLADNLRNGRDCSLLLDQMMPLLSSAVKRGAVETVDWIFKRSHRNGPIPPLRSIPLALSAFDSPNRSKLLQILSNNRLAASIWDRPDILLKAVTSQDLDLLKMMHSSFTTQWDIDIEGRSLLMRAMDLAGKDSELVRFLVETCGVKSFEIVDTIEMCLTEGSMARLNELKDFSLKWGLITNALPGNMIVIPNLTVDNPEGLLMILDWISDPSNMFNLQLDRAWLTFTVGIILGKVVYNYAPEKPEYAQCVLAIARHMVNLGIDVYTATDPGIMYGLASRPHALQILTFMASVPGGGFIDFLESMYTDHVGLSKMPKSDHRASAFSQLLDGGACLWAKACTDSAAILDFFNSLRTQPAFANYEWIDDKQRGYSSEVSLECSRLTARPSPSRVLIFKHPDSTTTALKENLNMTDLEENAAVEEEPNAHPKFEPVEAGYLEAPSISSDIAPKTFGSPSPKNFDSTTTFGRVGSATTFGTTTATPFSVSSSTSFGPSHPAASSSFGSQPASKTFASKSTATTATFGSGKSFGKGMFKAPNP